MIYGTHPNTRNEGHDAYKTFRDLDHTVRTTTAALRPVAQDFDALVVTGVSGLVVGAPVALKINKTLLVLRKQGEDSHGFFGELIGAADVRERQRRVVFLDDLISEGTTYDKCRLAVHKAGGEIVGRYLYDADEYTAGDRDGSDLPLDATDIPF